MPAEAGHGAKGLLHDLLARHVQPRIGVGVGGDDQVLHGLGVAGDHQAVVDGDAEQHAARRSAGA